MKKIVWLSTLAILGISSLSLYIYTLRIDNLQIHVLEFEYIFFALFALYLIATVLLLKAELSSGYTLTAILVFALAFRIVLLVSAPSLSHDIYRYVWDGKVQAAGINPYLSYPDSEETPGLKDELIYPFISSKSKYDPYQPASQLFFRFIYLLRPDSVFALKLALILFDLGSIALIISILKELKMNLNRVLLYAWSPLIIFEISQSGHIDALIAFLLSAAILAGIKFRHILTGILLGLAISAKMFPLILLPAFLENIGPKMHKVKMSAALIGITGLLYLPFIRAGSKIIRFIFEFQGGPWFNSGVRYFLSKVFARQSEADIFYLLLILVSFVIVSIVIFSRSERGSFDFIYNVFLLSIVFVVFTPSLAPWHLVFIIPLLAIRFSPSLLYLSGAVMLSYLFYAQTPQQIPEWVRYVEYIPFFILLVGEIVLRNYVLLQNSKNNIRSFSKDWLDK